MDPVVQAIIVGGLFAGVLLVAFMAQVPSMDKNGRNPLADWGVKKKSNTDT